MLPYQERVIAEKNLLDQKIHDLGSFINSSTAFKQLSKIDQDHLIKQKEFMVGYSNILGERISRFTKS